MTVTAVELAERVRARGLTMSDSLALSTLWRCRPSGSQSRSPPARR